MRKIGISLATLLVAALSACAESPTSSAAGAGASLNGFLGGSGNYEEGPGGTIGTGHVAAPEEDGMATTEAARNPGLGLTGN